MSVIQKIKRLILDIIFPIECLGCGQPDTWLCPHCIAAVPLNEKSSCPVCHLENNGAVCSVCQGKTALNGLLIATSYNHRLIQNTIHALKYNFVQEVAQPLGAILAAYVGNFDKTRRPAILQNPQRALLVPVPLHRKRLLERGFNQSELLARSFNAGFSYNFQPLLLTRKRYTEAQAKLKKHERENNLHDAFALRQPFNLSRKNVILIDDVATTLSTLNECAKVLKQAGCHEVWGLVIARGS